MSGRTRPTSSSLASQSDSCTHQFSCTFKDVFECCGPNKLDLYFAFAQTHIHTQNAVSYWAVFLFNKQVVQHPLRFSNKHNLTLNYKQCHLAGQTTKPTDVHSQNTVDPLFMMLNLRTFALGCLYLFEKLIQQSPLSFELCQRVTGCTETLHSINKRREDGGMREEE